MLAIIVAIDEFWTRAYEPELKFIQRNNDKQDHRRSATSRSGIIPHSFQQLSVALAVLLGVHSARRGGAAIESKLNYNSPVNNFNYTAIS